MSRIEFMRQLETLLKDISADERTEALQYYNDYFDDAGVENEEHIITELGSPQKVAVTIKAGLKGANEQNSQYSETGYTDTRFEEKESPANRYAPNDKSQNTQGYTKGSNQGHQEAPRTSTPLKVLLIVLIVIIGVPIAIPLGFGLLIAALSIIFAFFAVLISLAVASVAIAIAGIAMFVTGIVQMFITFPIGLALAGAGLIVFAIGMVATAFSTKLCGVVIPSAFRALVELCRRPFKKREVSA